MAFTGSWNRWWPRSWERHGRLTISKSSGRLAKRKSMTDQQGWGRIGPPGNQRPRSTAQAGYRAPGRITVAGMIDPRYAKLAKLLVEYSTKVKRDDVVLLDMIDVP